MPTSPTPSTEQTFRSELAHLEDALQRYRSSRPPLAAPSDLLGLVDLHMERFSEADAHAHQRGLVHALLNIAGWCQLAAEDLRWLRGVEREEHVWQRLLLDALDALLAEDDTLARRAAEQVDDEDDAETDTDVAGYAVWSARTALAEALLSEDRDGMLGAAVDLAALAIYAAWALQRAHREESTV